MHFLHELDKQLVLKVFWFFSMIGEVLQYVVLQIVLVMLWGVVAVILVFYGTLLLGVESDLHWVYSLLVIIPFLTFLRQNVVMKRESDTEYKRSYEFGRVYRYIQILAIAMTLLLSVYSLHFLFVLPFVLLWFVATVWERYI